MAKRTDETTTTIRPDADTPADSGRREFLRYSISLAAAAFLPAVLPPTGSKLKAPPPTRAAEAVPSQVAKIELGVPMDTSFDALRFTRFDFAPDVEQLIDRRVLYQIEDIITGLHLDKGKAPFGIVIKDPGDAFFENIGYGFRDREIGSVNVLPNRTEVVLANTPLSLEVAVEEVMHGMSPFLNSSLAELAPEPKATFERLYVAKYLGVSREIPPCGDVGNPDYPHFSAYERAVYEKYVCGLGNVFWPEFVRDIPDEARSLVSGDSQYFVTKETVAKLLTVLPADLYSAKALHWALGAYARLDARSLPGYGDLGFNQLNWGMFIAAEAMKNPKALAREFPASYEAMLEHHKIAYEIYRDEGLARFFVRSYLYPERTKAFYPSALINTLDKYHTILQGI